MPGPDVASPCVRHGQQLRSTSSLGVQPCFQLLADITDLSQPRKLGLGSESIVLSLHVFFIIAEHLQ